MSKIAPHDFDQPVAWIVDQHNRRTDRLARQRVWLQSQFRIPVIFVMPDGPVQWKWTDPKAEELDQYLQTLMDKCLREVVEEAMRWLPYGLSLPEGERPAFLDPIKEVAS